jgi:hypothetical protein
MPRVGFGPTTPAFERAKSVHALDRVALVIGASKIGLYEYFQWYIFRSTELSDCIFVTSET